LLQEKTSFDPTGPYKVDYEGTKNLVDVAKAKGIEHFVFVFSVYPTVPSIELVLADFSLEEASRGISKAVLPILLCGLGFEE